MSEELNLLSLTKNVKEIKNPFFDVRVSWADEPFIFKKGTKVTLIGVLARHIAKHTFMAVRYRYYDEEKEKILMTAGQKAANKFNVSKQVEDKIWFAITGEREYTKAKNEKIQKEAKDLQELSSDLGKIAKLEQTINSSSSIADFLGVANDSAIKAGLGLSAGDTSHVSGGVARATDVDLNSQKMDLKALINGTPEPEEVVVTKPEVQELPQAPIVETVGNDVPEFSELAQLNAQ